jgi:hypothetical protein
VSRVFEFTDDPDELDEEGFSGLIEVAVGDLEAFQPVSDIEFEGMCTDVIRFVVLT